VYFVEMPFVLRIDALRIWFNMDCAFNVAIALRYEIAHLLSGKYFVFLRLLDSPEKIIRPAIEVCC
jgi:hypothetical protein